MSFGDSMRQTASIARCVSVAVTSTITTCSSDVCNTGRFRRREDHQV